MISIFNGGSRTLLHSTPADTFVQVHHTIMPHLKEFGSSDWMVFTTLALHMDSTGFCWPSMGKLVATTGLSEATVRRSIESLCNITISGAKVLAKKVRHDASGRQTSNGYILFPDAEGFKSDTGEGIKSSRVEGIKNDTPINKNHKERESQGTKSVKKSALPGPDDAGRLIFEAYRETAYPELPAAEFTLGEWNRVKHIAYQMSHADITPDQVRQSTQNLIRKWAKREMVTMNSLWNHWSAATTGTATTKPTAQEAVMDITVGAIAALRRVRGEST